MYKTIDKIMHSRDICKLEYPQYTKKRKQKRQLSPRADRQQNNNIYQVSLCGII